MKPIVSMAAMFLAVAAVEGGARWWMNPAPTGHGQPVLNYRPRFAERTPAPSTKDPEHHAPGPTTPEARLFPAAGSFVPLPDIYNQAAPMLRCSGGQVYHVQYDENVGIHLAFFEWNGADTGSVLEAFRHMPEACMGSLGMILVSKEPPVSYQVDGKTLVFDHTIFREPSQHVGSGIPGALVHAYRAIWVADMADANARQGLGGDDIDRLRTIRLKSALTRFRPTHARVIQGAVRGALDSGAAWHVFEETMLKDLTFEPQA